MPVDWRAGPAAARRLLNAADILPEPPPALLAALTNTAPGRTATIELTDMTGVRSFALATGELALAGRMMRIGALIDIDAELKAAEATALRELVQVLSHEIVNTLTPIASLADTAARMLEEPQPPLAQVREAIETVARRAASLYRFGESYRALARLPTPMRERLSINELATDLQRLFAARWPEILLVINLEDAPPHIRADSDQLTAALWALLQNGAEALHATRTPRIDVVVRARVGHTQILVEDNGPGIAAADRVDIFRPFFTTKSEGTGVGLALARQICRGHAGDIVLATSEPGGTCFMVTLPGI